MPAISHALKEWNVAIEALLRGETILLLRKGGIRESGGKFAIAHNPTLLYPTYEHQKPELLKEPYGGMVKPVDSGWHPESITIHAWATITETVQVSEAEAVEALLPFHIWNETFVHDRLQWKPKLPLAVLFLRVYRLTESLTLPYDPAYGGCKSWIDLAQAVDLENSLPALSDRDYEQTATNIRTRLQAP